MGLQKTQTNAHTHLLSLLDTASISSKHLFYWALSSIGTFIDGFTIMLLSIALSQINKNNAFSSVTLGMVAASLVLGAIPGSNFGGNIGDKIGRKKTLLFNMLIILFGALLSFLVPNVIGIGIGHFVIGIGIGSDFAVGSSFISEILPTKKRSRFMVGTISMQAVGLVVGGLSAWLIVRFLNLHNAWRYFFLLEIVFVAIASILRLRLIESPRWLMTKGLNQKAAVEMARLIPEKQADVMQMAAELKHQAHHVSLHENDKGRSGWFVLFSKVYLKRTLLVSLPWFLMDIATYGVGMFTPIILSDLHFLHVNGNSLKFETDTILGYTLVDSFLLIGFALAWWLVPEYGRIKMQIIGFAGMVIGMVLLYLNLKFKITTAEHTLLIFSGFIIFNLLMNTGPNSTTFTLAPELFPTHVRASASGFAAGFAKIGATLGIFFLPVVKEKFGMSFVLGGLALIGFGGILTTLLFASKISEDKTLEERHIVEKP